MALGEGGFEDTVINLYTSQHCTVLLNELLVPNSDLQDYVKIA